MADVERTDHRDDDEEIIDAVEDTDRTDEVAFDEEDEDEAVDQEIVDIDADHADPDEATVSTTVDVPARAAASSEDTVADGDFEIVEEVIEEVVIIEEVDEHGNVQQREEDVAPSATVSSARPEEPMPLSENFPSHPLPTGGVRRRSAPPRRPASRGNDSLKEFAVPIFAVVGLMLLIPAVWAVLLLSGSEYAWNRDDPTAGTMAKLMLVCWPLAAMLLATAVVLFLQVQRKKRDAAAGAS